MQFRTKLLRSPTQKLIHAGGVGAAAPVAFGGFNSFTSALGSFDRINRALAGLRPSPLSDSHWPQIPNVWPEFACGSPRLRTIWAARAIVSVCPRHFFVVLVEWISRLALVEEPLPLDYVL
jgi:hypothetical protein